MSLIRWLFAALGLASLAWIIRDYGPDRIAGELRHAGWLTVPLLLTFAPTLACYALAWQLVTGGAQGHSRIARSSARLFAGYLRFTVISIAWNNLSPFVKVLGEPVKVLLLEEFTDRKNAVRSVVVYNIVHLLGTLGAFTIAAALIPLAYPVSERVRLACWTAVGGFAISGAALFFLPRVTHKFLRRRELRSLRYAALWTRWSLHKIDFFFSRRRAALAGALALEVAARFIEGLTFWVAFLIIREPVALVDAAFLEVGRALVDNAFFFVPYQVGSREIGISLFLREVLGSPASGFVAAALLYRLVEIAWMAVGYMLWIARRSSARSVT